VYVEVDPPEAAKAAAISSQSVPSYTFAFVVVVSNQRKPTLGLPGAVAAEYISVAAPPASAQVPSFFKNVSAAAAAEPEILAIVTLSSKILPVVTASVAILVAITSSVPSVLIPSVTLVSAKIRSSILFCYVCLSVC
jgi:hypothetical protein